MKDKKITSDSVREQPQAPSAAEVVEKSKAAGSTFDASAAGEVRRRAPKDGSRENREDGKEDLDRP